MSVVILIPKGMETLCLNTMNEHLTYFISGPVPFYTHPSNFRPPPPSRKHPFTQQPQTHPCLLDFNKMDKGEHIKRVYLTIDL